MTTDGIELNKEDAALNADNSAVAVENSAEQANEVGAVVEDEVKSSTEGVGVETSAGKITEDDIPEVIVAVVPKLEGDDHVIEEAAIEREEIEVEKNSALDTAKQEENTAEPEVEEPEEKALSEGEAELNFEEAQEEPIVERPAEVVAEKEAEEINEAASEEETESTLEEGEAEQDSEVVAEEEIETDLEEVNADDTEEEADEIGV
ncbi:MAG: hypothetical protein K2N18_04790, partial [Clostridia bacterium]|nr:hypothetical protein [Clostridia bacterium]